MQAVKVLQDGLTLGGTIRHEGDIVPRDEIPDFIFDDIVARGHPYLELIDMADDMALPSSLLDEEETGEKGPHLHQDVNSGRKYWVDGEGRFICGSAKKDGTPCMWVVSKSGEKCRHHRK